MKKAEAFRTALFALAGLMFGALIAHPYVMLVYMATAPGEAKEALRPDFAKIILGTFSAKMLPMAAAFSFFCALIGLLLGFLYGKNRKLAALRFESQRREAVTASLRNILAILSHFILNSTMVIEASVKQLRKGDGGGHDLDTILERIERQAEKNERVLSLMKECNYLEHLEDPDTSLEKILELTRLIEERAAVQVVQPGREKETAA